MSENNSITVQQAIGNHKFLSGTDRTLAYCSIPLSLLMNKELVEKIRAEVEKNLLLAARESTGETRVEAKRYANSALPSWMVNAYNFI